MAGIIKVNQYQDFNGNTLFTSDGNGNLTTMKTNYPAFLVDREGTDQDVNNQTLTTVQFNRKIKDTNNAFDLSNYKFTCPAGYPGLYHFTSTIQCDDDGETWSRVISYITHNDDARIVFDVEQTGTFNKTLSGSRALVLAEGDTVYCQVDLRTITASTPQLVGDNRTWFSGFRIGS